MSKQICRMATHDALWPANIDTAHTLVIDKPCKVTDAYYLFTDRPNIKTIKVAGLPYSRQELGNMEPHLQLGRESSTQRPIEPAPIPGPPIEGDWVRWVPTQAAQAPQIIFDEVPIATWDGPVTEAITAPPVPTLPTLAEVNEMTATQRANRMTEFERWAAATTPPTLRTTYISPEYQRAYEAIYRDHPNYMQFGDIAIADTYTQA